MNPQSGIVQHLCSPWRPLGQLLLIFALLFSASARADDPAVGVLTEMAGDVRLLRAENYLQVERGVEVHPQDIVETGANGSAQIDLKDGSVLRLGPNSRLALSDYKLDKDRNVISATVDVLTGWLRFAVSKLRKDDSKYRINAPSLTIGIRGTEGVVEAGDRQGGVHLVSGRIEVGGQDAQGKPLPPVQVNAGQYIQRLQGQAFRRYAAPPPTFQNRVPRVVVRKLVLKPLKAGERPIVRPKVVRQITREEARKIILRHPHARDRLQRRFKPVLGPMTPDGARLKRPQPGEHKGKPQPWKSVPGGGVRVHEGIGGQIPATNRQKPIQRPGTQMPTRPGMMPPRRGMMPPQTPASPPGVPVPYPNLKPGMPPPRPGIPPGGGLYRPPLAKPMLTPASPPADGARKKPEGQKPDPDSGGQSNSASSSPPPPPPRPPNLIKRPPPRKMIRMMR